VTTFTQQQTGQQSMTYPSQYGQPAPQVPYGQPAPQYAPNYPTTVQGQSYGPPPGYAPVAWGALQPAMPPAPPLAQGSLDEYYNAPTTGEGASLFKGSAQGQGAAVGTAFIVQIARAIRDSDVQQQTELNSTRPAIRRDGNPKWVLRIPVKNVQLVGPNGQPSGPSPLHPEGTAVWYVQGATRDELTRANTEAGAPQLPESDAWYWVAITGTKPTSFGTASKVYSVKLLQRGTPGQPQNSPAAEQPQTPVAPPAPPAPPVTMPAQQGQQYPVAPAQMAAPSAAPNIQYPTFQPPAGPAAPTVSPVPQPPAAPPQAPGQQYTPPAGNGYAVYAQPAAAAPPVPQPPGQLPQASPGLTAEQQAAFAAMLGTPGPAPAPAS
jgi:hypothetical protein